jgi:hypothetical protein
MGGGPRDLGVGEFEKFFSVITGRLTMVFNAVAGL